MKKIIIIASFLAVFSVFGYTNSAKACWFCSDSTAQKTAEQQSVTSIFNKLSTQTPIPQLDNSLERANISKRLTTWSDPAKISYIYLINYGRVMGFYVVKGKVTSGSKRLTANQQLVDASYCNRGNCNLVVDSPELDGTYGTSGNYIFFWTTDGTYVQWSGDYMLTDQPMQLSTQPELVRNVK